MTYKSNDDYDIPEYNIPREDYEFSEEFDSPYEPPEYTEPSEHYDSLKKNISTEYSKPDVKYEPPAKIGCLQLIFTSIGCIWILGSGCSILITSLILPFNFIQGLDHSRYNDREHCEDLGHGNYINCTNNN